jgi:lipopolysaccharide transport system ATP-binding protein
MDNGRGCMSIVQRQECEKLQQSSDMSNATPLIKVENLSKKFCGSLKESLWYGVQDITKELVNIGKHEETLRKKEFWALKDISFELRPGECLGLIGHNGAGKSTLLKLLNGLFNPSKGEISVRGRVGALIQLGAGFNPVLSGRENIYINASVLGISKKEIEQKIDDIIRFAELEEYIDSPVQYYSSGMYARLGFSVAVHTDPDILLVDEILSVGDVAFQSKSFNRLGDIKKSGAAIILVTHNLHHVTRFCDRVLYLKHGKVVCMAEPNEAVAHFTHDLMVDQKQTVVQDGSDFSQVNGNGKVVFEKALFLDANGSEVSRIQSGLPVTFRIYYRCHEEIPENPILDLVIRDQDGDLFQGTNQAFGFEFGRFSKQGYIDIYFERIVSNNQTLNFFFSLWNSNMSEMYDWKRYVQLEVLGNPLSTGRVLLDCQWTQSPKLDNASEVLLEN